MNTLGYLGPQGSHSHQAIATLLGYLPNSVAFALQPQPTLACLLTAIEQGEVSAGLLPYENALEGSVMEVLQALGTGQRQLFVHAEFVQPIRHALVQHHAGEAVTQVYSHPMALAQCRQTLLATFGDTLTFHATASTSEAVSLLAQLPPHQAQGMAALATTTAAEAAGLAITHPDMSDAPHNVTRFMVVTNQPAWPTHLFGQRPTPDPCPPVVLAQPYAEACPLVLEKCSICFSLPEYPGTLMKYLELFYAFQVNLSKLESRPKRTQMGDYYFFVDCEGDITTVGKGLLFQQLTRQASSFHCQGPYLHWVQGNASC
jgi:prephenate dehydratase